MTLERHGDLSSSDLLAQLESGPDDVEAALEALAFDGLIAGEGLPPYPVAITPAGRHAVMRVGYASATERAVVSSSLPEPRTRGSFSWYGLIGLPMTFILDSQGDIVEVLPGPQSESTLREALESAS